MRFKFILTLATCFTFFLGQSQTDDGRENNTKVIKVKNDIYMLQGKGGNIGFSSGNDGVFMIDDQFADATKNILKDIQRVNDKPIKFLVNTHHHGDHTGGNANIAAEGAVIVAHSGVYKAFEAKAKSKGAEKIDETAYPVITFENEVNFHFNGESILVFHVDNAHTDGDAIVYFTESNVVHAGDVLFKDKYPYIDAESGGSVKGYMAALDKLTMLCDVDTKIIPGHGNLATLVDVRAARNMLFQLHRSVTYHFLNRKTEQQILAMRDFTAKYDALGFGNGFISTEKILKIIYDEVSEEQSDFDPRTMEERLKAAKEQAMQKQGKPHVREFKQKVPTEAERKEVEKMKAAEKKENGGGL